MGQKRCTRNNKIKGKGKIVYYHYHYYFGPYIKLRTEDLPIVEQEILVMVKKIIITKRAVLTNDFEQKILNSFCGNCLSCGK